jgi:hypothetical protein
LVKSAPLGEPSTFCRRLAKSAARLSIAESRVSAQAEAPDTEQR